MKRVLILLSILFCPIVFADTINLNYMNEDNTVYQNSTCTIGNDLIIPNTNPTKRGYTFAGWRAANVQKIEYLESTGIQYIDTGYKFDGTVKLVFKINWNNINGVIFGANSNGGENFLWSNAGYLMGVRFDILPTIQTNTDYTVEMQTHKGGSYIKINNVNLGSNISSATNNLPILLFAESSYNSISRKALKLYYFQIYQNDIIVRDFVPLIKDGIPCMYDKVESKFFYGQDIGNFIAGPVISE